VIAVAGEAEVRDFVRGELARRLEERGIDAGVVRDDFDFLAEGAVDSFGLIELIGSVERRFGVTLDFEGVDADDLTLFGPFCSYAASKLDGPAAPALGDDAPAAPAAPTPATGVVTSPTLPAPSRRPLVRRVLGSAAIRAYSGYVRARNKVFSLSFAGGFHSFGQNTVIQLPARIDGAHRISIGSGGFIGSGSWLHVLAGTDDGVAIEIGDGVSATGGCVISAVKSIRIGENVSLARGVYISDHTHVYEETGVPVLAQGTTEPAPVEIGDGAWLGENAMVFPGVRIGAGAVIGGNAVVTQDVPDRCLALGAPARVVRRLGSTQPS
jgi:acetyltransferase-like isoleucine patch superfamily enzyme/acyl carrier protein